MHSSTIRVLRIRSLKYTFDRNSLDIIYKTYIRPIMEYSSVVWDCCTTAQSNQLEILQNAAARIVTGLPIYCPLERLQNESDWETLQTRRKNQRLIMFYKIVYDLTPTYLKSLLPPRRRDATNYNTRQANDFTLFRTRTAKLNKSFFPSTTRLWNRLPDDLKHALTVESFKYKLSTESRKKRPPLWLSHGHRKLNIIHTRLRNQCSDLNDDLYHHKLSNTRSCDCGAPRETSSHYFLVCKKFTGERNALIEHLNNLGLDISLNLLLKGTPDESVESNRTIMSLVQNYIKDTGHFALYHVYRVGQ